MSDLPPADWYPDPEVPGQQRYWDGTEWTEHRAPGAQPAAPGTPWQDAGTPQWAGQPPVQAWGPIGVNPAADVDPWLWQSIVVTVLGLVCCSFAFFIPILGSVAGGVGIVYAAQANTAKSQGNRPLTEQRAQTAKVWTLAGAGLVGLGVLLFLGFILFGIVSS